jgi:excisionase family DNA binding protein
VSESKPPPSELPRVLKVAEVAALLRVNRKTLYEAVRVDGIPGAFRVGHALRFDRDALLAFIAGR